IVGVGDLRAQVGDGGVDEPAQLRSLGVGEVQLHAAMMPPGHARGSGRRRRSRSASTCITGPTKATAVEVDLAARDGRLELLLRDDGVGPGEEAAGGRGLENMRTRAVRLGGTLAIAPG